MLALAADAAARAARDSGPDGVLAVEDRRGHAEGRSVGQDRRAARPAPEGDADRRRHRVRAAGARRAQLRVGRVRRCAERAGGLGCRGRKRGPGQALPADGGEPREPVIGVCDIRSTPNPAPLLVAEASLRASRAVHDTSRDRSTPTARASRRRNSSISTRCSGLLQGLSVLEPAAFAARVPRPLYNAYRAAAEFVSTDGHTIQFSRGAGGGWAEHDGGDERDTAGPRCGQRGSFTLRRGPTAASPVRRRPCTTSAPPPTATSS